MSAAKEKRAAPASRVRELWGDVEKRFGDIKVIDLSYIDKLTIDETFRDEFVRLPYDRVPIQDECSW